MLYASTSPLAHREDSVYGVAYDGFLKSMMKGGRSVKDCAQANPMKETLDEVLAQLSTEKIGTTDTLKETDEPSTELAMVVNQDVEAKDLVSACVLRSADLEVLV